jgi:hypothetical protein
MTRRSAIPVLGDGHPCTGDHEGRGGGDVERVRAVAARSAHIDHERQIVHDPHAAFAHGERRTDDLIDAFTLGREPREQRGRADRRKRFVHDRADHSPRVGRGKIAAR